jgi:hypothetical protein
MAALRHPDNVGHRVLVQPRPTRVTAHTAVRDRSYARAIHVGACQRADWLRSMSHVLLIGRDLLFAIWAIAVFAFWLAIIVAFVL